MPSNSKFQLMHKIKEILLSRGYSIAQQPTIESNNLPFVVDLMAIKGDRTFLIEVNNGIRIGVNNISELLKFSQVLRAENRYPPIKEVIITDSINKIDPEVRKISDKMNIKIITFEDLKTSGFSS